MPGDFGFLWGLNSEGLTLQRSRLLPSPNPSLNLSECNKQKSENKAVYICGLGASVRYEQLSEYLTRSD